MRSPICSLISLGQLLKDKHNKVDVKQREKMINAINSSSRVTYNLLENLLQWAKSESGLITINPKQLNIKDLFNNNVDLFQQFIVSKNITINDHINKDIFVFADFETIDTVVRNLLSNAIKFTPDNGKIDFNYTLEPENEIRFCVSDTGKGIKHEDLEKIFNPVLQFTTSGTKNEKGTGLGLNLCKEFIKKNGGDIHVESEPGKGSKFYFTLKIKNKLN